MLLDRYRRRRGWREVDVDKQDVVKFFPTIPPTKGEPVLVDGERCRVVKVDVEWSGPRWTIRRLIVEAAPR